MINEKLEGVKQGEDVCFYRDRNSGNPFNAMRLRDSGILNLDGD